MLYISGWRRRSGAFWRGAPPQEQGVRVLLCVLSLSCGLLGGVLAPLLQRLGLLLFVLPLLCGLRGASLHRCLLRQQPRGSLRRPRRARGIAISPKALLGFSNYPLKRRRSAEGLEAAERCVLMQRPAVVAKGDDCCFAFCRCLACFRGAFLRRLWLRQQPCGSLRRPRRARGIAISP